MQPRQSRAGLGQFRKQHLISLVDIKRPRHASRHLKHADHERARPNLFSGEGDRVTLYVMYAAALFDEYHIERDGCALHPHAFRDLPFLQEQHAIGVGQLLPSHESHLALLASPRNIDMEQVLCRRRLDPQDFARMWHDFSSLPEAPTASMS